MSWPDGESYLYPLQSLVVFSPHISRIHSSLFSDWRHTVSSKFFDTQVPSISIEELVLPRHAPCVLSRQRYNVHSLLLSSSLSRIGRIENPLCSACGHSSRTPLISLYTVQLRTLCAAHSLASLCSFTTSDSGRGEFPASGAHGPPSCPDPSKGVG